MKQITRNSISVLILLFTSFVQAQSNIYFIHNDHLGTPQAVTDIDQNVVWKSDKTPFGQLENESGGIDQPIRFPGQYADPETGYYYNYYRDYDPTLGRYIQSDPVGILWDYSDPQMQVAINQGIPLGAMREGLNHNYGYVKQNPLVYSDPYGDGVGLGIWCAAVDQATSWSQVSKVKTELTKALETQNFQLEQIYKKMDQCDDDDIDKKAELDRLAKRITGQIFATNGKIAAQNTGMEQSFAVGMMCGAIPSF